MISWFADRNFMNRNMSAVKNYVTFRVAQNMGLYESCMLEVTFACLNVNLK